MRRTLLVLFLLPAAALARPTAYGLAIGNNAPPSGVETLPTLRFADDDAVRVFQFFQRFTDSSMLLSVLDADTQRRYPELGALAKPPSTAELERAVAFLAEKVRADVLRGDEPTVYLSFSGHGAQDADGTAFLALSDGRLTRQQLYDEVIARIQPAFVNLFVDACHAEGVVAGRGDVDVPTVALSSAQAAAAFEAKLPSRFPRLGALWATTVDQQAHEWSRIESGLFTHELLSALSGAADVNGDGIIEYSEVQAFIGAANRDLTDPRAIPKVVVLAPVINVHAPLLTLSRLKNTAFLLGPFDGFGRFFVELANGQRALDAHLSGDQSSVVAVPAGRVFVVTSHGEAEVLLAAGETRRSETLALVPRASTARGALSEALDRALFQSAFGATYYKGFVDSQREVSVVFRPGGVPSAFEQLEQRRSISRALVVASGVLFAGALVSGVAAGVNLSEYERTQLQRPAAEAHGRMVLFGTAAGIAGGLALASAIAGWLWWPSEGLGLSGAVSSSGGSIQLSVRW